MGSIKRYEAQRNCSLIERGSQQIQISGESWNRGFNWFLATQGFSCFWLFLKMNIQYHRELLGAFVGSYILFGWYIFSEFQLPPDLLRVGWPWTSALSIQSLLGFSTRVSPRHFKQNVPCYHVTDGSRYSHALRAGLGNPLTAFSRRSYNHSYRRETTADTAFSDACHFQTDRLKGIFFSCRSGPTDSSGPTSSRNCARTFIKILFFSFN